VQQKWQVCKKRAKKKHIFSPQTWKHRCRRTTWKMDDIKRLQTTQRVCVSLLTRSNSEAVGFCENGHKNARKSTCFLSCTLPESKIIRTAPLHFIFHHNSAVKRNCYNTKQQFKGAMSNSSKYQNTLC
jgi:hypothetical protein